MAKLTRRRLGALLASSSVAVQVANAQVPATQPARGEGDADQESARQQARNNAQAIGRVKLPMTTEPAFRFKA